MMSRTAMLVLLGFCGLLRQAPARAAEGDESLARPRLQAPTAPVVPIDVCGTHESMLKFSKEAAKLITTQEGPYFAVKQRLMRVNDHYVALYDTLAKMMPPKDDIAAEALWRFDALGALLQESSENLERLGREMKTATRVCNQDLAAYEAEFGEACPAGAAVGCAEGIYVRYCSNARKRNRVFKIGEETQTVLLKWPRFFDTHWAGPTRVGEAGEGWREEWTYGSEEQVWQNLGAQTAQDENRLENLAWTEEAYSAYTMVDTKPLVSRMVYNMVHGNIRGGVEQSLGSAIDAATARIKRVMRCEITNAFASKPGAVPAAEPEGERPTEAAEPATAGAE